MRCDPLIIMTQNNPHGVYFMFQQAKVQFFSNGELFESLFHQKSAILRLKNMTSVTLKSCRGLNLGPTPKIMGSKKVECPLDDPIG